MTLSEFINEQVEALCRFKLYWSEEHQTDSKNFPMEMNPGDWDEQYNAFNELHDRSDSIGQD